MKLKLERNIVGNKKCSIMYDLQLHDIDDILLKQIILFEKQKEFKDDIWLTMASTVSFSDIDCMSLDENKLNKYDAYVIDKLSKALKQVPEIYSRLKDEVDTSNVDEFDDSYDYVNYSTRKGGASSVLSRGI